MKIKKTLLIVTIAMISSSLAHAVFERALKPGYFDTLLQEKAKGKSKDKREAMRKELVDVGGFLENIGMLSDCQKQLRDIKIQEFSESPAFEQSKNALKNQKSMELLQSTWFAITEFYFLVWWADAFTTGKQKRVSGRPISENNKQAQLYLLDAYKKFILQTKPLYDSYKAKRPHIQTLVNRLTIILSKVIEHYNLILGNFLNKWGKTRSNELEEQMNRIWEDIHGQENEQRKNLPVEDMLKPYKLKI